MWLTILSDQLPVNRLGRPLPYQLADRTRAHLYTVPYGTFTFSLLQERHIGYYPHFREAIPGIEAGYSRVTHPFAAIS